RFGLTSRFLDRPLSERHYIFHVGARGRDSSLWLGEGARGYRGGLRFRLPGEHHRIPAVHLRFLLSARGEYFAPGLARRHSSDRRRTSAPPQLRGRRGCLARAPERLGIVVR